MSGRHTQYLVRSYLVPYLGCGTKYNNYLITHLRCVGIFLSHW